MPCRALWKHLGQPGGRGLHGEGKGEAGSKVRTGWFR